MKKAAKDFSENRLAFRRVLKLLDNQLKSIEAVEANPAVISAYKHLLKHLRALNDNQIDTILKSRGIPEKHDTNSDEFGEQLSKLNLDEIAKMVQSQDSSRKYLEKIATTRFGMTRGEISRISNKSRLVEQLTTLINNEKAHQSIKRMASSKEKDL
jgi:hypothetical protein